MTATEHARQLTAIAAQAAADKFGKDIHSYPWYMNITPVLYYVLYTFLLRQFLIDLTHCRDKTETRKLVNIVYVTCSLLVYGGMLWRA